MTVGEGDEQSKSLQRDVETDWLNAMLPVTYPYGSEQVPTFPLSTEEPEGFWLGICYFNDSLPDQYNMEYRIDVPDLEGRRAEARLLKQ